MTASRRSPSAQVILAGAVGLLLLAPSLAAPAPPELVTDRPDQTESAETVPPGRGQLEIGWLYQRDHDGAARTALSELPGSLVRIGVTERLELRWGWSGHHRSDLDTGRDRERTEGFGDASAGVKLRLLTGQEQRPDLALLVSSSLPVGSSSVGSERFDPELRLAAALDLTERVGLGANLGVAWASTLGTAGVATEAALLYTLVAGTGLSPSLGAFLEVFGEEPLTGGGRHAVSLDGGLTWLLRPHLQLDLAGGAGLTDAAPDWFVGLGLSGRWPE